MSCISWESVTAFSTATLAIITGLLATYTYRLWRATLDLANDASRNAAKLAQDMQASLEIARQTANAADLSARAAVGIELPILRVILPDLLETSERINKSGAYSGVVNDGSPTKYSAIGNLEIKNYGRTVAIPESMEIGWMVTAQLPDVPQFKQVEPFRHADTIKPEGNFIFDSHFGIELTEEEQKEVQTRNSWLWVYGCIYYRDFLGQRREARFCWRFANRNEGHPFYSFASDGNPPPAYINQIFT